MAVRATAAESNTADGNPWPDVFGTAASDAGISSNCRRRYDAGN
jgi:hypothetical protein